MSEVEEESPEENVFKEDFYKKQYLVEIFTPLLLECLNL